MIRQMPMPATIGGALGSALESSAVAREAAYGYRPESDDEQDQGRVAS